MDRHGIWHEKIYQVYPNISFLKKRYDMDMTWIWHFAKKIYLMLSYPCHIHGIWHKMGGLWTGMGFQMGGPGLGLVTRHGHSDTSRPRRGPGPRLCPGGGLSSDRDSDSDTVRPGRHRRRRLGGVMGLRPSLCRSLAGLSLTDTQY